MVSFKLDLVLSLGLFFGLKVSVSIRHLLIKFVDQIRW